MMLVDDHSTRQRTPRGFVPAAATLHQPYVPKSVMRAMTQLKAHRLVVAVNRE